MTKRLHSKLLIGLSACCLCISAVNADIFSGDPVVVQDLDYGEILFDIYQGKSFSASVNLLIAKEKGRLKHHANDTDAMLGGFYLSYGLYQEAESIFTRVLDQGVSDDKRNVIWLHIAKARYRKGLYSDAIRALEEIGGELTSEKKGEINLLMSNILMARNEYEQAVKLLKDLPGDADSKVFARYNLGVALFRSEQQIKGTEQLDIVGRTDSNNPEVKALRDKANLALGFALLANQDANKAKAYFERVRLNGPFSNKALLGMGWANAIENNYEAALAPWTELKKRPRTDASVYESFLAVPYAFEQLKAYAQALAGYDEAIKVLKEELVNVEFAESSIKDGNIWNQLIGNINVSENSRTLEIKDLPAVLEVRYISSLIANNNFQDAIITLRDLQYLKLNLKQWRDTIPAYQHILELRRKTYNERLPKLSPEKGNFRIAAFKKERDVYEKELQTIIKNNDIKRLATTEEQKKIEKLNAIGDILSSSKSTMDAKQYAEYERRYSLLKGLLEWDIGTTIRPRQWKIEKELRHLDMALDQTIEQQSVIERARKAAPRGFKGYDKKISSYEKRIVRLQKGIDSAFEQQKQIVQDILLSELIWLKQRLTEYMDQANYATARLQDLGAK